MSYGLTVKQHETDEYDAGGLLFCHFLVSAGPQTATSVPPNKKTNR